MKLTPLHPLCFEPVYKDYLWGGQRLASRYGRDTGDGIVAESWEVADRPEGMSVVRNGPLRGRTLAELVETYGTDLTGSAAQSGPFPLLIKLIDAARRLSVQVHPDDETAPRVGGEAKNEMWYMLPGDAEAVYYAGLKAGTTAKGFRQALAAGTVADRLVSHPATPGRVAYIRGGCVHAIGSGCLILEVQQNSNTTYRVYDWDRVGPDGRPRELHVEQAMTVIRWDMEVETAAPDIRHREGRNTSQVLLRTPYFEFSALTLREPLALRNDPRTFRVLFAVESALTVAGGGESITLPPGSTCLLPAALENTVVTPETAARVAVVTLP